ncbi:MAG: hypothetical protein AAB601_03555 [Patescibacteria group bacterium]
MGKNIRIATVLSTFLILTLHMGGAFGGFYEARADFDIPLHLLGGFWIGTLLLFFYGSYARGAFFEDRDRATRVLFLVAFVALIGVLWEFFEFGVSSLSVLLGHAAPGTGQTYADTLGDLALDLVGGSLAGVFFIRGKPALKN